MKNYSGTGFQPVVAAGFSLRFLQLVGRASVPAFHWTAGTKRGNRLDILKKRYAEGEFTKDEFERMKWDILG